MTNTNTAAAINQIPSQHFDLSWRYNCRAYMTVVTFMFAGIVHRARRFFRADMPTSGKIELYTLEPHPARYTNSTACGWYESAVSEDWLCYAAANPTSRRDRLAHSLIESATGGDVMGAEQQARYSMIEAV